MPRETKYCIAPRAWNNTAFCGKPFLAETPVQLYCSRTCANRAHRVAQVKNRLRRAGAAGAAEAIRNPLANIIPSQIQQSFASSKAAAALDQEAELAKLGYAADPHDLSISRQQELGISTKPKVDRSAEPITNGPPQFDNSDLEDDDPFNYRAEKL